MHGRTFDRLQHEREAYLASREVGRVRQAYLASSECRDKSVLCQVQVAPCACSTCTTQGLGDAFSCARRLVYTCNERRVAHQTRNRCGIWAIKVSNRNKRLVSKQAIATCVRSRSAQQQLSPPHLSPRFGPPASTHQAMHPPASPFLLSCLLPVYKADTTPSTFPAALASLTGTGTRHPLLRFKRWLLYGNGSRPRA